MEKLLKTEELADILNLKPNTLEIWRVQGKGPVFIKTGKLVRYRPEDVDKFMAEHSQECSPGVSR